MKKMKSAVICLLLLLLFPSVCFAQASEPEFTEEELRFINTHPVVKLCVDPEFVPYEFVDSDGEYKGIAADYIKLLSEKTGIEMVAEKDLTWTVAYEMAVERKLDVLPCVAKTPQREQYFLFSEPYIDFQRVIVVQDTNNDIKDFSDLKDVYTAVQKNSSHNNFMTSEHPEIPLNLYSTVEDALTAVSVGEEKAYVGNLATTSYLIKEHGFTNLKFIIINSKEKQSLYFAVRNDWPELVGIINKGLASITEEEKIEINNKWIGVENEIDYGPIIRIIAVILFFLLISVFWTIRLKREVKKRIVIEEELIRAKQEAEIANQIKSSFLARMSHEIRTPLNAITGMAYLIKKTDVNTTQKMYLDKITQASHTMLGIINDILDFSKIEAGKVELEKISFNLDKVIQEVINIISFRVEEQDIEFKMSKDPNIPVNFFGDPKRIEQILINLINNAVKFTSDGEVSLEISQISRSDESSTLEFRVKDTGIGMSEEQVTQLFTPFAQGDSSINRRFGGTGLGLSIVKSLTELMDGEVEVNSVPGEGSTFIIKLPLEIDQMKNKEERQQTAALYFREVKALVLDRSVTDMHLIEKYLASFGIPAIVTESESEALKLIADPPGGDGKPFDLFLIDYETPADNGLEFASRLKDDPIASSDMKFIMMVPLKREDIFQKIEEAGIDFGIAKPIIPSILFNGIIEIFKARVPETEKKTASTTGAGAKQAAKAYRTLVVEDNRTNQLIVREILEQAGFITALADNGEEGVNYFRKHQNEIDLILMDLHMPVLNGYEASSIIRTLDSNVPIVAMTADAITGVDEECRKAGIDFYISKPFDPDKLIETLHHILEPLQDSVKANAAADKTAALEKTDYEYLDVDDGLKRIGNNPELYKLILKEFVNEFQDVAEELKRETDARNYPAAIQIVHKFKGGAGSIGAKKPASIAAEMQKALTDGEDRTVGQLYDEFDIAVKNLFAEAEKYIQS